MSLYLKYRPQTFDEVYGQDDAVALLKGVVAMPKEERPKVFLLAGASGCGKTTLAGVFARAIGVNPNSTDCVIQDASKDRSIDNIRRLCDSMGNRPMGRNAEGRVYIMDECHQLLRPAQEALLKKCEDTPPATYIFFCTTEPDSLGKALRSRCKCITIKPLSTNDLVTAISRVASAENIVISKGDMARLAEHADGSARVALQLLESYRIQGSAEKAIALSAGLGEQVVADTRALCQAIVDYNSSWSDVVEFCNKYRGQAEPVRQAILGYLRACLLRAGTKAKRTRFISLMECFLEPHYDCGDAALVYQMALAFELK